MIKRINLATRLNVLSFHHNPYFRKKACMFCSPFLTHGRGLKLLSLPGLAEVSEWVSPGMGRHLQAALPQDRPGSRTAQRPSTVDRTSPPRTPAAVSAGKHRPPFLLFPLLSSRVNYDTTRHPCPRSAAGNRS